jgi:hypothetical protein
MDEVIMFRFSKHLSGPQGGLNFSYVSIGESIMNFVTLFMGLPTEVDGSLFDGQLFHLISETRHI